MKKIMFLALALFFMNLGNAFADYSFSYVDGTFSVSGTLLTGSSDGLATITGGTLNTPTFTAQLYTGGGTIPATTPYLTSPSGGFWYDNRVSPGSTPVLTNPGLLFVLGTYGTSSYKEINIFGNSGAHDYSYYEGTSVGNYFNVYNNGTFTLTAQPSAVPVPPAALLLGTGLFGLVAIRKKLK